MFGLAAAALIAVGPALAAPRVVAATTDLAALAARIGGDGVVVETIVPPAVDPEAFEPRPSDLDKVRRADLLVRVGLGYDYWLDKLVAQTGDKRLMRGGDGYIDASTGVALLEIRGLTVVNEGGHAHGVANPHYWLDPANAGVITAGIAAALARLAPADADRIMASRARFQTELDARMRQWGQALAPHAGTKLIAYHNTWPYFARRFRLDIIDFIEPKPGVSPSPAHLARLIAAGHTARVRAILHEPYEPDDMSRLLAQKLDAPFVLLATSVGSVPGVADYLTLFDHNVATLAKALSSATQ